MGDVTTMDSTGWWAFLSPAGDLPYGATESVPVGFGSHDTYWDWGWFDVPGNDQQCAQGPGSGDEVHMRNGQPWPSDYETHCVETETSFTLDLTRNDTLQFRREIDWVAWNLVTVGDSSFYVDDEFGAGGWFTDVVATFHQAGGTDTVAPAVEITANQSATEASWDPLGVAGDGKYHIPMNFIVRLGAWPTTTTASPKKTVLVRYFWNHGSDYSRTGFVSLAALATLGLARTHQYSDATPPDTVTVRAHFVLPHQVPSPVGDTTSTDYGKTLDLDLIIENDFTAVISVDDTVFVGDTVDFTDPGANGGGLDSLRWSFGDGGTDTTAAPSHVYTTSGTKTVVLTKTHAYHDLQVADTTTVLVVPPLVVGPIVAYYEGWPTNNEIEENGDCLWEVDPQGGFGTYSYVWQKYKRSWSTIPDETGSVLYMEDVGTHDFDLRTIISSGPLTDTTEVLSMTVDPDGQACIIRK